MLRSATPFSHPAQLPQSSPIRQDRHPPASTYGHYSSTQRNAVARPGSSLSATATRSRSHARHYAMSSPAIWPSSRPAQRRADDPVFKPNDRDPLVTNRRMTVAASSMTERQGPAEWSQHAASSHPGPVAPTLERSADLYIHWRATISARYVWLGSSMPVRNRNGRPHEFAGSRGRPGAPSYQGR